MSTDSVKRGPGKHAAPKLTVKERFFKFVGKHKVVTALAIGLVVAAVLGVTFWFEVFSGLASSADFIYSQF